MSDPATEKHPFAEIGNYFSVPRLTALAVSGRDRVVVTVDTVNPAGAAWTGALWQLDTAGHTPLRLTRSEAGESSPTFLSDGTLAFISSRQDDEARLWSLPAAGGEAELLGRYPGGVRQPVAARDVPAVLVLASRPVGTDVEADRNGAEARQHRKDTKTTAILHTGMPIRRWDHELGDVTPRLLLVTPGADPVDLIPEARFELSEAAYDLSADAARVVTTWSQRRPKGRTQTAVAVIDVGAGHRSLLTPPDGSSFSGPRLSPDGSTVALVRTDEGDFYRTMTTTLCLYQTGSDARPPIEVDLGDTHPSEWCWSPDGTTIYVTGDWHGRGAVVAVAAATGAVLRRLAVDAAYTNLVCSADGAHLYALRSSPAAPPGVARLDTDRANQEPVLVPFPGAAPDLPGTIEEVAAPAPDGAEVRAWLCRPQSDQPAPVMLWIHGGPFTSWNAWSWRWNPWVAVARGWAVLLVDPALSTGYGQEWLARAWPHRAETVWRDLEAVLDAVLARSDLDAEATACLGASFGGYMTNWIAGHTDRFKTIVTHAGLWALDQQHATTDAAEWKNDLFGSVAEHPEWYAANSPHLFADHIQTPMLVVHGNRDYRVPVSEALRLWWDLVSRHEGPPETLRHRFLQFTGEHHWVLSPANSRVWYETVLAFCEEHTLGRPPA